MKQKLKYCYSDLAHRWLQRQCCTLSILLRWRLQSARALNGLRENDFLLLKQCYYITPSKSINFIEKLTFEKRFQHTNIQCTAVAPRVGAGQSIFYLFFYPTRLCTTHWLRRKLTGVMLTPWVKSKKPRCVTAFKPTSQSSTRYKATQLAVSSNNWLDLWWESSGLQPTVHVNQKPNSADSAYVVLDILVTVLSSDEMPIKGNHRPFHLIITYMI